MGRSSDAVIIVVADHLDELARNVHDRLGAVAGVAVTMAWRTVSPRRWGPARSWLEMSTGSSSTSGSAPAYAPCVVMAGRTSPTWRSSGGGRTGRAAAGLGVRCCVSLPVEHAGEVVAVAKVYASEVDGLSSLPRQLAVELAGEVAGSIGPARTLTTQAYELDDRASAMDARHVIDLAIGAIMERAQCSADVAFATLSQPSQHTITPVTVVARTVVSAFGGAGGDTAPFDPAHG